MRPTAKLLLRQPRFKQRRSRRMSDILTENGKTLPQRKRLERQNNLHIRTLSHTANQLQILPQQLLLHHITRRWNLIDVLFQ